MDLISEILTANQDRDAERLALKYRAMRDSQFAFLRGTCSLFHARLRRGAAMKSAPLAWCCGDLHLGNFGSYKGDNRLVYFDINDFDEAALAPLSWDLVRLVASLRVASAELHVPPREVTALCRTLIDHYAAALAAGKPYWVERDSAQGAAGTLMKELRDRRRPAFLDSRTVLERRRRRLRLGIGKALAASEAQRARVQAFMAEFARSQPVPEFFEVLDVARRVAGTGSLGVDRYVVLVRGKGSPDGNYLLDLKRALPSALAARVKTTQPRWPSDAERVVSVQQRTQAVAMAFLHAVRFRERPYVLRALHPSEDRVDFRTAQTAPGGLAGLVATLAQVTAWAHLRGAAHRGADGPDTLQAFGRQQPWRKALFTLADEAAQQVQRDALAYARAYDQGAFGVPKPAASRD
jgi:uncharacterized protein (DUF2252 family)